MSKNLKESLIEQQDLYGAPPFKDEPVNSKPISGGIQALYGVPSPSIGVVGRDVPALYGPPPADIDFNTGVKVATGGSGVIITILLFIVGLFAMLNKKLSKTAKIIIGVSLLAVFLAILLIVLLICIVL